jgi:L-aminopeptidase/D-esterase-like protein
LRIAGVPVGKFMPVADEAQDQGSIIIVVATDAPLLPQQLKRLARRASLGLARNGSYSGDGSGDLFLAFSTANATVSQNQAYDVRVLANGQMNPLFLATVQSVEESIVNALVAAETMTGLNGTTVPAIDTTELKKILKRFNRLQR